VQGSALLTPARDELFSLPAPPPACYAIGYG